MLDVEESAIDEAVEGLDPEDGVLWVYDDSEDGALAFTDFGIDNLRDSLRELDQARKRRAP